MKPYNIYNLFSNFGNIDLIVFDLTNNDNQKLIIQFENVKFAKISFRYLNNIKIYGFYMRMQFLKDEEVVFDQNNPFMPYEYFKKKHRRFDCRNSIEVNYPSNTLILSNLESELTKIFIFNIIQSHGICEELTLKRGKREKNICFVKMQSIEESIKVVIQIHNIAFKKNQIKISFTNSKF